MRRFEVGDRVEGIEGFMKEITGMVIEIESTGCWILPDKHIIGYKRVFKCFSNLKLIKEGKEMCSLETPMKQRIEALTGWDKEADDILQEILGDMKGTLEIIITIHLVGTIKIKNLNWDYWDEVTDKYSFGFGTQCGKLEAFKNALLFLAQKAEKASKLDDKKDKARKEIKELRERMDKLEREL